MKLRMDFVTNSSSSSFIITNKTNKVLTGIDIAEALEDEFCDYIENYGKYRNSECVFEEFIYDAEMHCLDLGPNESETIECGDHSEDGIFENVIHSEMRIYKKDFDIEFFESNH